LSNSLGATKPFLTLPASETIPVKHHGANAARFFNYVNLCLGNKFRTIRSTRLKNPLCRPGNLSLTADCEDTDREQVDDEFTKG
jgi:hypothetical protein